MHEVFPDTVVSLDNFETGHRSNLDEVRTAVGDERWRRHRFLEEDITNALIRLSHAGVKTVCFVEGHGEKSLDDTGAEGYSDVKSELAKEDYKVQSVNLVTSNGVPAACTVLVIAGPRQALFPQEAAMVGKYLDGGGKVFVLADPGTHTGLSSVLTSWNINLGDNIVIDASGVGRLFGTGPAVPLVHDYGASPITEGFSGSMTFFPLARTVSVADTSKTTPQTVNLLETSPQSFTTPKIMVLVLPFCIRLPLTSVHSGTFCGSGTSSRVTSTGPSGQKVSKLLPRTHCPPLCRCQRRAETNPLRVLDCKVPQDQPLIEALPRIGDHAKRQGIGGAPPSLLNPPRGCRFAPRCAYARDICWEHEPQLVARGGTMHVARCWGTEPGGWLK